MSTALAVVMAVASSASYAVGDVLASRTVRRHTAASVATWVQVTGLVMLVALAAASRPHVVGAALAWGVAGGVIGAFGVLFFYTALQNGPTSVVAPISATSVVVPLLAGVLQGDVLTATTVIGLVVVIAGVLLIAAAGDTQRAAAPPPTARPVYALDATAPRPVGAPGAWRPAAVHDACRPTVHRRPFRTALLTSVLASVTFGLFFVLVERATAAAAAAESRSPLSEVVLVALAVQTGALVVTVIAATRHTRACLRSTPALLKVVGVIGLVDVTGDLLITYALGLGPLALVGTLGSLNPVFAVLAAAVLFRERLSPVRVIGIAAAFLGVGLVIT